MAKLRNEGSIPRLPAGLAPTSLADSRVRLRILGLTSLLILSLSVFVSPARAEEPDLETSSPAGEAESVQSDADADAERPTVAVLPFRIHSAGPVGYLTESLADLLATRMEATGKVSVIGSQRVLDTLGPGDSSNLSEAELKNLAARLGVQAVISGSLTELAGRFSLDVRMTEAGAGRSESIVIIAQSEEDLLGRLSELADRAVAALSGTDPSKILAVRIEGAYELEGGLRGMLKFFAGSRYEPAAVREDRARIEEHPGVASVSLEVERKPNGVELVYTVVRSERLFGGTSRNREGKLIGEVKIRGNRRIDAEAIQTRVGSSVGMPLNELQVAADIKSIFELGFFRDVKAFVDVGSKGRVLIFEVEENPVVREITISGNDEIEGDEIKEILTLTTGSTLDRALLAQNIDRIGQLYRARGYYLATSDYKIEEIVEGSVAIHFEVEENKKLHLEEVTFVGNEAFTSRQLRADFATKLWRPWSLLTSWFDQSGTYQEPIFMRDLRGVEKMYSDSGYLQVEIGEPQIKASEDGLRITINIREGPQYRVGMIDVSGDDSVDFDALLEKLHLERGEIFNRSHLTEDVEALERHYTDRGFYFASVEPGTRLNEEAQTIDVEFRVKKGPLYFIRHIDIGGNTTTIDPVIRRELKLVEGQLYSARDLKISNTKVSRLGFFEDVAFEPQPTDDPAQLDLKVTVAERPTGSLSFGAGFSSQDKLVFTASLSQANLLGRGYAVNLQVDLGGSTSRYFFSVRDPHFLGSGFSFGGTVSMTNVNFDNFKQRQRGFEFSLGHSLREDNTANGFLRYSFSKRRVEQDTGVNASAAIFREILQGNESSSMLGLSFRSDTRNDHFAPTAGTVYGSTIEFSGLGGFAKYIRLEARYTKFLGAPRWMFNRSSFVFSSRIGYTYSFNTMSDFGFPGLAETTSCDDGVCSNAGPLKQINADLTLPLTERYFLGGIGAFQLRGYKGRTVGPRRAVLHRNSLLGEGSVFTPVGRLFDVTTLSAPCKDDRFPSQPNFSEINTQGNKNGRCNDIEDSQIEDFEDLQETDAVGGNKFALMNFEYRFPMSEEVGLQAVFFVDSGQAFAEGENLFNFSQWRYSYGGGILWYSPFGPLQVVLGFPINPLSIEKSPVFEFSVGGFVQ